MKIKKLLTVLTAAVMAVSMFAGCKKDEESVSDSEYSGVLTQVRLGMPRNKILSLNSKSELFYDDDYTVWCVNPDTDIMELRDIVSDANQFYYVQDSLITYSFRHSDKDDEDYLTSYQEEVVCKVDRKTAEKYFDDKGKELAKKYKCTKSNVTSSVTGTEGVDNTLEYKTGYTLSSFEVILDMIMTYDTVDGVTDYYATHYSIEVKELKNKSAVPTNGPDVPDDKEGKS